MTGVGTFGRPPMKISETWAVWLRRVFAFTASRHQRCKPVGRSVGTVRDVAVKAVLLITVVPVFRFGSVRPSLTAPATMCHANVDVRSNVEFVRAVRTGAGTIRNSNGFDHVAAMPSAAIPRTQARYDPIGKSAIGVHFVVVRFVILTTWLASNVPRSTDRRE